MEESTKAHKKDTFKIEDSLFVRHFCFLSLLRVTSIHHQLTSGSVIDRALFHVKVTKRSLRLKRKGRPLLSGNSILVWK